MYREEGRTAKLYIISLAAGIETSCQFMYRPEERAAKIYIISLAAGIGTRASSCTERRGGLPSSTSSSWQQVLRSIVS
jgi:hypothetical protein